MVINSTVGYFLLCVLLFFVVMYDRNLLVTYHLMGNGNVKYLVVFILLIWGMALTYLLTVRGRLSFLVFHRPLVLFLLLASMFFITHELLIGNRLISAKYAILLLLLCVSLGVRQNYFFILRCLVLLECVCHSL